MKIITIPDSYDNPNPLYTTCFLAGGLTKKWRSRVCDYLQSRNHMTKNLVCFNPEWAEYDPSNFHALETAVSWETYHLSRMDIFSMYLCNGENNYQSISLYELGRYVSEMKYKFPNTFHHRIVISIESGYIKEQDVFVRSSLSVGPNLIHLNATPESHAKTIMRSYNEIRKIKNLESSTNLVIN